LNVGNQILRLLTVQVTQSWRHLNFKVEEGQNTELISC
jgi:hypothetical protein